MKPSKTLVLITTSVLLSPWAMAQTPNTAKQTTYGDNPNIVRVIAGKTQSAVQHTAEKIGAATERGIEKIKPTVDGTWNNTKDYTTEQAVIARDNTRQGIDTAVQKVKETKNTIIGHAGVPIERGTLSQTAPTQLSAPAVSLNSVPLNPAPVEPVLAPIQHTVETQNQAVLNNEGEPEIQRQSLPIQNNLKQDNQTQDNPLTEDADAGIPR